MIRITVFILLVTSFMSTLQANEYNYKNISDRYADVEFDRQTVKRARMEGECLLGLKKLRFKKQEVNEWGDFQSPLLKQFSPCTVLIMMETAFSRSNVEPG